MWGGTILYCVFKTNQSFRNEKNPDLSSETSELGVQIYLRAGRWGWEAMNRWQVY